MYMCVCVCVVMLCGSVRCCFRTVAGEVCNVLLLTFINEQVIIYPIYPLYSED